MRSLDSPTPARVAGRAPAQVGAERPRARGAPGGLASRSRLVARTSRAQSVGPVPPRRPVGSVARAIALLDALAASESGLGVNELARRIGVNASTASRLLATLESAGLVERAADGGPYRLGLRLVALSDRVLGQLDVRQRARPLLVRLVDETGETATLSVPAASEAITVDFVPSRLERRQHGARRAPERPARDRGRQGDAGVRRGSERSPRRRLSLRADRLHRADDHRRRTRCAAEELGAVRERGYAEAVGEREPDLAALAAPVFGRGGELSAILGLQGPASRLPAGTRRGAARRRCWRPRPSSSACWAPRPGCLSEP